MSAGRGVWVKIRASEAERVEVVAEGLCPPFNSWLAAADDAAGQPGGHRRRDSGDGAPRSLPRQRRGKLGVQRGAQRPLGQTAMFNIAWAGLGPLTNGPGAGVGPSNGLHVRARVLGHRRGEKWGGHSHWIRVPHALVPLDPVTLRHRQGPNTIIRSHPSPTNLWPRLPSRTRERCSFPPCRPVQFGHLDRQDRPPEAPVVAQGHPCWTFPDMLDDLTSQQEGSRDRGGQAT